MAVMNTLNGPHSLSTEDRDKEAWGLSEATGLESARIAGTIESALH